MKVRKNCPHCRKPIAQYDPKSKCDHIHYPEGCTTCEIIQKINQYITLYKQALEL